MPATPRGVSIPGLAPSKSAPVKSAPALLNPGPVHVVPSHSSRGVPSHAPVLSAPARVNPGPSPRGVGASLSRMAHSKAYKQAVLHTFLHQPKPQQAAIVKGALRTRSFEGDTILKALRGAGSLTGPMTNPAEAAMAKLQHEPGLSKVLADSFQHVYGSGGKGPSTSKGGVEGGYATLFGGPKGGMQILQNTGKDVANLPAETFSTLGTLGADVAGGHVGKLASDALGGYKQILENPAQAFYGHPLNTALAAYAPIAGVTGLAADAVRGIAPESAAARALGPRHEIPPSVHLEANLTHERPALSRYPLTRAAQKVAAKGLYTQADGHLVPRTEFMRERLLRKEVSRSLVGERERIRRAAVDVQKTAHAKSVLAPKGVRLARSAKKALTYNPGSGLIHGANVLARIADHTVRRPDKLIADLEHHRDQVVANRPNLDGLPKAIAEHEKYVADLKAAIADKALRDPKHVARLFDAAHTYARDIRPLQDEAFKHGHYGDHTKDSLLRRELQPVILSHMPGARLDSELGMVKDVRGVAHKLSTAEMVAFDKAQTGGRPLAYTSHQAPKGNSAFYTNQQKYPARAIQKNTGFAFTHGLSDPTHEALLEHRAHLENTINAHRSMDHIIRSTVQGHPDGGYWKSFKDAKADAPEGYKPFQVGRMTSKADASAPHLLDSEAAIRQFDINERTRPSDEPGKFGLIDKSIVDQLQAHQNQISPNQLMRAARASTSQFRRVALGTSVRHIPGVTLEGLLRDIGAGLGVRSLISGKNVFKELEKIDPRIAAERREQLGGGTVAGMTRMMETRQGSKYFSGTVLGPPMKAVEAFMKAPGARPLATAWNHWQHAVITGTKKVLEQNQQTAAVGQALLKQSGQLMALQGKAAQDAAKGLLDDRTVRQLSAQVRRVHGTWTDLTPSGQAALMFSPFGMWWVNSVKWLARMPVDQPIKTGLLASATTGTEKQRQAEGLDMFSPNHLAGYLQGSIPAGGKLLGEQYYSAFGVAGDPSGTAASLMEPTLVPAVLALMGDNYLGRGLRSPSDPHGRKGPNEGTKALVALNSVLSNFLPLYMKAQTVAQGGASSFDTSTLMKPQTKATNPGVGAGLLKIVQPVREFANPGVKGSSSSSGWGDPSSPSSTSGWGAPATTSSSGWG